MSYSNSNTQKSSIPPHFSYNSLYTNPLNDTKNNLSSSEGDLSPIPSDNKENAFVDPNKKPDDSSNRKDKEANFVLKPANESMSSLPATTTANSNSHKHIMSSSKDRVLKPSSLHFCMQMHDNVDSAFGLKSKDRFGSENSNSAANSVNIWDFSDSEAAPASSWSTLPNRTLLCRPLPADIGKCTCVILREDLPNGVSGGCVYSLYTSEGKGRQDRKLAVAIFKRHKGKSVYNISQSTKGSMSNVDDNYIGAMTANVMGSKYHIWNQGFGKKSVSRTAKSLLAIVTFVPTITTWTGSYRTMRAYIPKHQSMQLKNTAQIQHIGGLPKDWEERVDKVHQLISKAPHYNKISKQYELDFRDRGRAGLRIQRSVKNFQLKLGENGKQTILQLGRVGKSKYVMDYRYPLTGYQAFCICLASIDAKLCCTV